MTPDALSVTRSVREVAGRRVPRSKAASSLLSDLLKYPPEARREHMRSLDTGGLNDLVGAATRELGTPYGIWADDPVGFVRDVLKETTWSKQRNVLRAIPEYKRVAVPSAFGVGKTHIAARAALWRSLVYPPGTSLTVTTATRFRQVQRQLWPHIRSCVSRVGLPLQADQTQLKAVTSSGDEVVVAYGFSAPPGDEAAVQGIHSPKLFIVVDEAGGFGRIIGEAMRGLLTGDDTRMLAIGNPPTDDEASWFESLTEEPDVKTVTISAYDAPLQTGERVRCLTCPPQVPAHLLGSHLVDQEWIDAARRDHGDDSPFVQAKVHARFVKGGPSRAIPSQWVEDAADAPEPDDGHPLSTLGLEGESDPWRVRIGDWVRLGVDVAADGGDELVVARVVGDLFTIRHASSGAGNANATDVAGKVLAEIRQAEALASRLGTTHPVRVKIDAIGVGWGVTGILRAWGTEGMHNAQIVPVVVSETTHREEAATFRPHRKRDEMWLAGRAMLAPVEGSPPRVRLRVDPRSRAQLTAPTYGTNSSGYTVIEPKKSMKARGLSSPDRAEALLLGLYEPAATPTRKARLIV